MRIRSEFGQEIVTASACLLLGRLVGASETVKMEQPRMTVRQRVLVADDDRDICTLLQIVLAPLAEVTLVNDAESALALVASQPPFDAIVSDYMLPGIDGLEFVSRLRSGERDRHVPILMISGHGRLVGDRAREAGCDAFLDKPFTLEKLRSTVRDLLLPTLRCA
jgi:CheY-like chemotaxis protein